MVSQKRTWERSKTGGLEKVCQSAGQTTRGAKYAGPTADRNFRLYKIPGETGCKTNHIALKNMADIASPP